MKIHIAMTPFLVGNTVVKLDPEVAYEAVVSSDGASYTVRIKLESK